MFADERLSGVRLQFLRIRASVNVHMPTVNSVAQGRFSSGETWWYAKPCAHDSPGRENAVRL